MATRRSRTDMQQKCFGVLLITMSHHHFRRSAAGCGYFLLKHRQFLALLTVTALAGLLFSLRYSLSIAPSAGGSYWSGGGGAIVGDGDSGGAANATVHFYASQRPVWTQLTPAGVPKIIHFIYRETNVIEPYREALRSCVAQNPDWQVVLWTDDAIKAFMQRHFPSRVNVFAAFPHKIQRADAIRYLIMYKFGGLYMDLDMICHGSLLPSLGPFSCFLDSERRHQTQFIHNKPYSAMNSAMGCTPGHPFFLRVIEFVFHPDRPKGPFSFPYTIFITTGPAMLTTQYDQWCKNASNPKVVMLNETYFSPKINPRSGIYGNCRRIAQGLQNPARALSASERVCKELQQLGFENSDNLFITSRTVAIHQFTHLGYHNQNARTFSVQREFPRVKSYDQLEAGWTS